MIDECLREPFPVRIGDRRLENDPHFDQLICLLAFLIISVEEDFEERIPVDLAVVLAIELSFFAYQFDI